MNTFETVELLLIETKDFSLYIKGTPYNSRFESLSSYRKHSNLQQQTMKFHCGGESIESVELFDVETNTLKEADAKEFFPLFFENGVYQLVLTPKSEKKLSFYHEHPGLRKAVAPVGRGKTPILMGNLQFMNEVGYTSFSIREGLQDLLTVTLEVFPTKLSYKDDYKKLLDEVSEEVYNLAFHFIKKTFLGASERLSQKPSLTEFFRLIEYYYKSFTNAIDQIELQPHHQLLTEHEIVRGERIKKLDQKGRKFLRKNPHLFIEADKGIALNSKPVLSTKGLNARKTLTFDTSENRFVKWMMERLNHKLDDLLQKIQWSYGRYEQNRDTNLISKVEKMQSGLRTYLSKPFWKNISRIDRSVSSMVLQKKIGYRDSYKMYLIMTRGLALQGELFKMSVKDVATLYEYWTYLKMGQILRQKYVSEYQDVVQIRQGTLFVDLDQSKNAKQIFHHPQTGERIILSFQKRDGSLPTVTQKPDIMLEIEKKHTKNSYHYIFDAKYRIDFGYSQDTSVVGPLEEDINTMHRYRDALVRKHHEREAYERYSFGAYVLFPWNEEEAYREHQFYNSIEEVNIGGLPFLPNSTLLVEKFLERLVESNPEDLQEEGLLPTGAISYWQSSVDEKVLIGTVNDLQFYKEFKQNGYFTISSKNLKEGWQLASYVALYVTQEVSTRLSAANGIQYFAKVREITVDGNNVVYKVESWQSLKEAIRPVKYGVQSHMLTTLSQLKEATELPELFMKSSEELQLWRMLRRLTTNIRTNLDNSTIDQAHKILAYQIGHVEVVLDPLRDRIEVMQHGRVLESVSYETLRSQPTHVFRLIKEAVFV